jgi:hypothetical protein
MLHANINKSTVKKHKRHTQMNKSSTSQLALVLHINDNA